MRLALISTTTNKNTLLGVKIIDKETLRTQDFSYEQVVNLLKTRAVEGLVYLNGELAGTNGLLERYEKTLCRLVVIYKTAQGYIVSDSQGVISDLSEADVLKYPNHYHIANGRLNKKGLIIPITGSYDYRNIRAETLKEGYIKLLNIKAGMVNLNDYDKTGSSRLHQGITAEGSNERRTNSRRDMPTGHAQGANQGGKRSNGGRHTRDFIYDGLEKIGYINHVDNTDFCNYIREAKRANPYGSSVECHTVEDYASMNCITFDSGKAGIAVHDGNIVSVFKHPDSNVKNFMASAMTAAVLNGGSKLDCYSINKRLPSWYARYGFIPVCKIKFNREFAPSDWNYERDGEPDIIFMVHCGDSLEDMRKKEAVYRAYSDYTDTEVPYVYDTEAKTAYDIASELRDNYLNKPKQDQNTDLPNSTTWIVNLITSLMPGRDKYE